ncbi:hypothetical protein TI03_05115, partial [Achromatium sp. WMS1]
MNDSTIPLILAIGGHDPSGGAGLQADIEAIAANGGHALSIVTALTTQNTCNVVQIYPQPASQIANQYRLILQESPIKAIKIGLLGNTQIANMLADLLAEHPKLPVVLDPILKAGHDNTSFTDNKLQTVIRNRLLPYCTLVTPNSLEARTLADSDNLAYCANAIINNGCNAVLITGAHEANQMVINRLYTAEAGLVQEDHWPRLSGTYHGSGCTLAATIATKLAMGIPLTTAIAQAQIYTWKSLKQAFTSG